MRFAESSIVLFLALSWALVPVGCGEESQPRGEDGPPPVNVQVVTVEPRDLPRTLSAVGSLQSPQMTTVASEIAEKVVSIDIPEGQRVGEGHVLARLDDAEARAALAIAAARLRNARDRLARLKSLRAKSVSSEQALDDAESEFDAAEAESERCQTRLQKTTIRAPFTGVLGLRQVNVGQYVEPGDPVVEITQVHPLELVFSLPQRHVSEIAVGQSVFGIVGLCEARFEGRVDAIDPRVDPATRTVRVNALVPNEKGLLYAGMSVRVRLVVGSIPGALVVPQEAIVRQGTKHIIYTVDGDGLAQQHEVTLGEFFVDGVHVPSGITAGERVVAAGQQKLSPGSPTRVEPYVPTENPNLQLGRFGPLGDCADSP
jgi:membrane fusion protein (multidrug efflux system)